MVDREIVGAAGLGRIGRHESLAAAEARHPLRPVPDDTLVDVEVVAAFLQHVVAGILGVAPPVAHEEAAVIGRDVLRGLDRGDLAEPAFRLDAPEVGIERRVAEREPDDDAVGPVLPQEGGELKAFRLAGDDRLLAEDPNTGGKPCPDMLDVQMVGRADHEEVESARREQGIEARIGGAGIDARRREPRHARRLRIDMADDPEMRVRLLEVARYGAHAEAEADDADVHAALPFASSSAAASAGFFQSSIGRAIPSGRNGRAIFCPSPAEA